jgi:hypothetical protein
MIEFTKDKLKLVIYGKMHKMQAYSARLGKSSTPPIHANMGFDAISGAWVWYPEKDYDNAKRMGDKPKRDTEGTAIYRARDGEDSTNPIHAELGFDFTDGPCVWRPEIEE